MTLNDILSRFDNLLEQEFRKAESQKKKYLFSGRLDDIASFLIHSFCVFQQLTGIVANEKRTNERRWNRYELRRLFFCPIY